MLLTEQFVFRFLTQIGLVKAEDQKKELFPVSETEAEEGADEVVQKGLRWAQARAEVADSPALVTELGVQATQLQDLASQEGEDKKAA